MSEVVGYQLVVISTGEVLQQWGGEFGVTVPLPNPIRLDNGDTVCGATVGWHDEAGTIELRTWRMDKAPDTNAPVVNGEALDARQIVAAKEEISALVKQGNIADALTKLLEIVS